MAKLFGKSISRAEAINHAGRMSQLAGAKSYVLEEGPARGVRGVDFWTGTGLNFTVLPDRGMDIPLATWKGRSLCWHASPGIVTPEHYEPLGANWLRTYFGGLLTTCGPRHFGAPADDKVEGVYYGVHDRFNLLSATDVAVKRRWEGDEYLLSVSGRLTDTTVFKPPITIDRTVSTRMGASSIEIHDIVTNAGFEPAPFMILYHCNIGYPLLSADTRLVVEADSVEPRDDEAAKDPEKWCEFHEPVAGFAEKCYLIDPSADNEGRCRATVVNPKLDSGLAVSFTWDKSALPNMTVWKMMGKPEYVLGIEPCNAPILARDELRKRGLLPSIEPGEVREIRLTIEVLEGAEALAALKG
ncbi:MAG: aldose 1-epimerase family protein [Planctomycetia bacterium]|nr:aldose 1-epimerase family protein [Planctomycetia bacterium]